MPAIRTNARVAVPSNPEFRQESTMHPDDQTFLRLFNASVPILQAPMAGVATPALAAAWPSRGVVGGVLLIAGGR